MLLSGKKSWRRFLTNLQTTVRLRQGGRLRSRATQRQRVTTQSYVLERPEDRHLVSATYVAWREIMSLFRGSCLGTHCYRGSCLASLSLEAGAFSVASSRAGALERDLTASFQAAWNLKRHSAWLRTNLVQLQRKLCRMATVQVG